MIVLFLVTFVVIFITKTKSDSTESESEYDNWNWPIDDRLTEDQMRTVLAIKYSSGIKDDPEFDQEIIESVLTII